MSPKTKVHKSWFRVAIKDMGILMVSNVHCNWWLSTLAGQTSNPCLTGKQVNYIRPFQWAKCRGPQPKDHHHRSDQYLRSKRGLLHCVVYWSLRSSWGKCVYQTTQCLFIWYHTRKSTKPFSSMQNDMIHFLHIYIYIYLYKYIAVYIYICVL